MQRDVPCICMYAPSAGDGMALYARELTTALAEDGRGRYRFELVAGEDLEEPFRSAPYPVHPILPRLRNRAAFATRASWVASRLFHYWRRERAFLRWLRGRPDVVAVHFQEWAPWLAAPVVRRIRRMGKKVFYTVHNVVPHKYPAWVPRRVMDRWIRRACGACDGLFVHTRPLANDLARFLGEPHPPIGVAPHGVWTVPVPGSVPPVEEQLARKRLLFFGTIRRNKGLDLLLDASDHLPGYSITVAGEPHDREYFRDEVLPRIARLRGAGRPIELLDRFVPDEQLPELFADHSVVILPYTADFVAQSGVVFLALAYGLPVVTSEAGGLRELLDQFRIGVAFREPTSRALADAVRSLCERGPHPWLDEQMKAARQRFTWRAAAAATLAGYQHSQQTEQAVRPNDCVVETTLAH